MIEFDSTPRAKTFIFGLDLGQVTDFTALTINQLIERPDGLLEHQARHLERWRGDKYPAIVRAVGERVALVRGKAPNTPAYLRYATPDLRPRVLLVIDHTGVGRPVSDMFDEAGFDCEIAKVTITAGSEVTQPEDRSEYRVPKRVLASTLQVVLQTERFKVQRTLPLAATLQKEMVNFKVRINLLGHESYGAGSDWREENHDDLTLSAALACWAGESGIGQGTFESVSPDIIDMLAELGI
jgi:hypothetical protein